MLCYAKWLQLCPILCDPRDLEARTSHFTEESQRLSLIPKDTWEQK